MEDEFKVLILKNEDNDQRIPRSFDVSDAAAEIKSFHNRSHEN